MDRAEFFQMVTQAAYRPATEANCVEKSGSLEPSRGVDSYLSTGGDTRTLDKHFHTLHQTFPETPIVISEYGYCAPERREGDERRIEILRLMTT
jgi:hypothetical protein